MKFFFRYIFLCIVLATNIYGSTSLNKGSYKNYSFDKLANYEYTVDLDVVSGDCDLYGHHSGFPTKDNYQFKSTNNIGIDEKIQFNSTQNSQYYLSVYGYDNCSFNPPTFSKKALGTPSQVDGAKYDHRDNN